MERMITRTIQKKVYNTLVFDCVENITRQSDFILTEKVKDNDEALKLLRKRYEGDSIKVCAIISTKIEEKLYAMTEVDFLKYAHIVEKSESDGAQD